MIIKSKTLSVDICEKTLNVAVTDLRNKAVWRTSYGGFHLKIHDIGCENRQWYRSDESDYCRVTVLESSQTQASFLIDFHQVELKCTCIFKVQGDRLIVTIPDNGWDLAGEKMREVLALDCLPLFGGRNAGAEGYLVLPHMGGVIRYFKDNTRRGELMRRACRNGDRYPYAHERFDSAPHPDVPNVHAGAVYGLQSQWKDMIAYPIWGAVEGRTGWCAYVPFERGDANTSIVTSSNIGPERLCSAHCRFEYREHEHDRRVAEERELVLTFFDDEKLNYATFGRTYRDYMIKIAGYPTLEQKAKLNPETDYMTGAFWANAYHALKRYSYVNNPNPDGKGILDVYMTFDEFGKEMRRWKKAGIEKVFIKTLGFNNEGHDGNYPTIFPIEPKVGGEAGFKRLIALVKELGYTIFPHINIRKYCRAAPDFQMEHLVRDKHDGTLVIGTGPGGDVYHVCPAAFRRNLYRNVFLPLSKVGFNGGLYNDLAFSILFRCYHPVHPLTRREYLNAARDYMKDAKALFGSFRAEGTMAPVMDLMDSVARVYTTKITEAAIADSDLAQKGLADEAVPLQAIIFHGQLLYCTEILCGRHHDYWAHFLDSAAIGALPYEEIRVPQPQWDDFHKVVYNVLCKHMRYLKYKWLENIEKFDQVTKSTYSDGSIVWVNHGKDEVEIENQRLAGRSCKIIPGSKEHEELTVTEDRTILDREPVLIRDGFIWADDSPREGLKMKPPEQDKNAGIMVGKDFLAPNETEQ